MVDFNGRVKSHCGVLPQIKDVFQNRKQGMKRLGLTYLSVTGDNMECL